ncbi:endo alpha-1,4 polygalactosaminidase [Leucothrix mucor]|uniref:endo alpha-1,4 polygalactosaminidase n=1 Tax=Leucothrix mucor TaxID=45248 RepID=UPI0003B7A6F0|nr:endo alpha-1,4 polygalactosaminidase [Leucothrix mucor]
MHKSCLSLLALLFTVTACNADSTSEQTTTAQQNTQAQTADGNWYRPSAGISWQWQLSDTVNTSYDVDLYDIDLFDSSPELIKSLQSQGRKVICYFSAGSYEQWREDAKDFQSSELGKPLDGWDEERWLDIRSANVSAIMARRMDLAAEKGCDGVEPDNVDGYTNESGFKLSAADQLSFNRQLANAAHERGLSVGLKNDLVQVPELVAHFDFAVNEQCFEYSECEALSPFIKAGKPVLNAEYQTQYVNDAAARKAMCQQASSLGLSSLVLPPDLDDSFRLSCL